MAEQIFKLYPQAPMHIGSSGMQEATTLTYIPSDTLFSALVTTWALIAPQSLPQWLQSFTTPQATPLFQISSAFPFAGSIRFFPKPQRVLDLQGLAVSYKRIKKAKWVSEQIFHQLRRGELATTELHETENFIQGGQIWLTQTERKQLIKQLGLLVTADNPINLWDNLTVSRVAVDRISHSANLFHSSRINFQPQCGLWFAARGPHLEPLTDALSHLQDAGIGGLRSTGHGAFLYERETELSPLPEPTSDERYFISLARFAPRETDLEGTIKAPDAAYQLTMVTGWCHDSAGHAWRRRRIRLVEEGAFLGWPGHLPGHVVDVTPLEVTTFNQEQRVYRYGIAFPVSTL